MVYSIALPLVPAWRPIFCAVGADSDSRIASKAAVNFAFRSQPRSGSQVATGDAARHSSRMSTLAEIERAADALPPDEKRELLVFIAARLRAEGDRLPEPRQYSRDQIQAWIAQDEADFQRFQRTK